MTEICDICDTKILETEERTTDGAGIYHSNCWSDNPDIRWYKGKYKVRIVIKGKRKGKRGPITYLVSTLRDYIWLLPEDEEYTEISGGKERHGWSANDCPAGNTFVTIPRLLWRHPIKHGIEQDIKSIPVIVREDYPKPLTLKTKNSSSDKP